MVRTDGGPEFRGLFDAACREYGIRHVTTTPHSPWRNGRAERMIRTVKALIRRMFVEDPQLNWEGVIHQI